MTYFFPVTNCFPGINACALFKAVVRSIPSLITDKENKRIVINKETDLLIINLFLRFLESISIHHYLAARAVGAAHDDELSALRVGDSLALEVVVGLACSEGVRVRGSVPVRSSSTMFSN